MVHVIRNAVDHGIEAEAARAPPASCRIAMTAGLEAGHLVLQISDDGSGIDWERVRTKARGFGLPCDTERSLSAAISTTACRPGTRSATSPAAASGSRRSPRS